MRLLSLILCFLLSGCVASWVVPSDFTYTVVRSGAYNLATYQRISDTTSPIHIYIEGDGAAFDAGGRPTHNPTPHGTFLRDLAAHDTSPNVVYLARPCQYIMSDSCAQTDWTDGRFSQKIIESMAHAIEQIAYKQPVILVGYSGGAMISGLIIEQHPSITVQKWVTIAGVLNHADWTDYFGDMPLRQSMNLNKLPYISQLHYIARDDAVVPNELSRKWVAPENLKIIDDATHSSFPMAALEF